MRILLIIALFSVGILTYAQSIEQNTQVTAQEKMLNMMEIMKRDYERFIDTPPSSEKTELAHKVKKETEQFAKQYSNIPQLPAVLELHKEVDIYLMDVK